MSIDTTKLAALFVILQTGKPKVAEILKVDWSSSFTRYYAIQQYDELVPFRGVKNYFDDGDILEAKLVTQNEQFHKYELNGDLSTEDIQFTFADVDEGIKTLFDTYGEGVKCSLYYYYPEVDLYYDTWWGHFLLPEFAGRGIVQVSASQGYLSREVSIGKRTRPAICTARFGGEFTSLEEYRGNGCVYNIHLPGGTLGNLDPDTSEPYTNCGKDHSSCVLRLDAHANGKAKYWLGFTSEVGSVVTDANSGYLAVSKGNASKLKEPISILFGEKYIRTFYNLFYRKELNSSHPENGFVRGVWEGPEGPNESLASIRINGKLIEPIHIAIRLGDLGQSPLPYASNMSGFSGTTVFSSAYGWVNAAVTELQSLQVEAKMKGYKKIRVYTDENSYTEIYAQKRSFALLELMTNNRFGRGYSHSKMNTESFREVADWHAEAVNFVETREDGEEVDHIHYRDIFDAHILARPATDVLLDIARAGAMSPPFQHEGQYHVTPLRKWTTEELEDPEITRVFTDTGDSKNIIWYNGENGEEALPTQSVRWSKIPDSKLINHLELTYEDRNQSDKEIVINIYDQAQKMKAGKAKGIDAPEEISRKVVAFGIRNRDNAIKYGFRVLNLGDFDGGGIVNNLNIQFTVFFEWALGLRRFDVIRVLSNVLQPRFDFEYFRLQKMIARADHYVDIIAQAYPVEFMENFEVDSDSPPPPIDPDPGGGVCELTFGDVDYSDGLLSIPIEPC